MSKALDLCFKTEQFSTLQMVAEDLTENTDPEMLTRCSQFFMEHGQYDRAVELAVLGKKVQLSSVRFRKKQYLKNTKTTTVLKKYGKFSLVFRYVFFNKVLKFLCLIEHFDSYNLTYDPATGVKSFNSEQLNQASFNPPPPVRVIVCVYL